MKVLCGVTQLLPQLSCAGIGLARLRRRLPFNKPQRRTQRAAKFELLPLAFRVVGQQRQLVQPLLKLQSRFRDRRAGRGPMTGLAPIVDGFFDETGLLIVLREELGLAVHRSGGLGFERLCDPRVQFLARTPKQHAVGGVLHQCVFGQ